MTEDDARNWITARHGEDATAKLDRFSQMLVVESDQQNLIAPSTVPAIWSRHLVDSAQLLAHATSDWRHWVDIGSGAGLPGIVIALLSPGRRVTLVEPRRLRVEFLNRCCDVLDLHGVAVVQSRAETADVADHADIVSARAVAKLDVLFLASRHFADRATTFILPKGEGAKSEVAVARRSWQGVFHVEQSIIDPKSGIVVATGIAPR